GPSCPQCNVVLTQKELESLKITWEKAPFLVEIPHLSNIKDNKEVAEEKGVFYVALLNGQKYQFRFEQVKTVRALKQSLVQQIGVESRKQKTPDDTWEVIPVGRLSNGNAMNYAPIENSIRELEGNIGQ
ncbi:7641_t:CDS:2, partial [Racocetra fulgida]